MSEELNALVQSTSGDDPRPEFVADLRELLATKLEEPSPFKTQGLSVESVDGDTSVEFDTDIFPTSEPKQGTTWLRVAAAAIGLVLVGWFLLSLGGDESELETIQVPEETETTIEPGPNAAPIGPTELIGTDTTAVSGSLLDPGTYETDTVGTALTFSFDTEGSLARNGQGILVFDELDSLARDDRTLTLRRLPALPDPVDLATPIGESVWPVDDLDGWIAAISDDALLSESSATEIGGFTATRFELQLGEFGCGLPTGCPVEAARDLTPSSPLFKEGGRYRVWIVDQSAEDPLVVVQAIDSADDEDWFAQDSPLIETFVLGEAGPSPFRVVGPGPLELLAFGGVGAQLLEEVQVIEANAQIAHITAPIGDARVTFLTSPFTMEGIPITTVEEMRAVFDEQLYQLDPRSTFTAGGVEIQSFFVESGSFPEPTFLLGPETTDSGWTPTGTWWVIEDQDLGLLIVEGDTFNVEEIRAWVDDLLSTLEFTTTDN